MKKYRVFTISLGWCDAMFIFDDNISFIELKNNTETSHLNKNNYMGIYNFDQTFLSFFEIGKIDDKKYYKRNIYNTSQRKHSSL